MTFIVMMSIYLSIGVISSLYMLYAYIRDENPEQIFLDDFLIVMILGSFLAPFTAALMLFDLFEYYIDPVLSDLFAYLSGLILKATQPISKIKIWERK